MECNKDEALRAREMAESKLAQHDYRAALKFLQKAQQLFPDIEHKAQLFAVTEVHIAAQTKINGTEMDWYHILQVDSKSDETLIKKQYRKLALLLHPDKNKSVGAESAFKLVGEASKILLDKQTRYIHDMRRAQVTRINKGMKRSHNMPDVQSYSPTNILVLTAVCPFCSAPFQISRSHVNMLFMCPRCCRPVQAREVGIGQSGGMYGMHSFRGQHPQNHYGYAFQPSPTQASAGGNNARNPMNPSGSAVPPAQPQDLGTQSKESSGNVEIDQRNTWKRKSDNTTPEKEAQLKDEEQKKKAKADDALEHILKKQKEKADKVTQKEQAAAKKRWVKKRKLDSSDDDDDDSSPSLKGILHEEQVVDEVVNIGISRRRSSRPKRNVKYVVDVSDDEDDLERSQTTESEQKKGTRGREDDEANSQKAHKAHPFEGGEEEEEDEDEEEEQEEEEEEEEEEVVNFKVPDADIYNFDKNREPKDVAAGQIWAAYDDKDGMPRFYFKIKEVSSNDLFKVHISWLELREYSEHQAELNDLGFSWACGSTYRLSKSQTFDSVNSFSHVVKWKKGPKGAIQILPNVGDVWALFEEGGPNLLKSEAILYKMVEVLVDFNEISGVKVVYLEKVDGFKTLYKPSEVFFELLPLDLWRFSHQVPAHRLKGDEAPGVTVGCWDLDPASLPTYLFNP